MNIPDAVWQIETLLPGRINAIFDLSIDAWFSIAAILTLWVYVLLSPGRDSAES